MKLRQMLLALMSAAACHTAVRATTELQRTSHTSTPTKKTARQRSSTHTILATKTTTPPHNSRLLAAKHTSKTNTPSSTDNQATKLAMTVAPTLGALFANAMFLSTLSAVLAARDAADMGSLNPIPLVAIAGNCMAWLGYSFATRDAFVFAANLPGLLLGLFYSLTAARLSASYRSVELLLLAYAAIIGVSGFSASMLGGARARALTGAVANTLLLAFYSAPLTALAKVLATRSSESLHAPLSLTSCLNGALWTVYGLAKGDPVIWAPNASGAIVAMVQLLLIAIFPPGK